MQAFLFFCFSFLKHIFHDVAVSVINERSNDIQEGLFKEKILVSVLKLPGVRFVAYAL